MATIYDIAKLSGISAATVSYVINGRGDEKRISKQTQEKVLAVAERLNYKPNVTARQLKVSGSQSIRIAAFWPEFYFEQSLVSAVRAISNVVQASVEQFEISFHFFTPSKLSEIWDKVYQISYNGILLAGASFEDLACLTEKPRLVPVVLINRSQEGFPSVSIDHEMAGRMACDLAYQYGGNSICAVWNSRFHVATNLRRTAFTARSEELSIASDISHFTCEGDSDAGYTLAISLLQKRELKKVLYCNNESIARGVAFALQEAGVKIGEDVLLFTANNGPDSFCRFLSPSITEIDLRFREVSEEALKLCLRLISHAQADNTALVIRPSAIFRQSMPEKI